MEYFGKSDADDSVILDSTQILGYSKPWIPSQARNNKDFSRKSKTKRYLRLLPLLCGTLLVSGCALFDPAPVPECTACMAVTIAPPPGDRTLPETQNGLNSPSLLPR